MIIKTKIEHTPLQKLLGSRDILMGKGHLISANKLIQV